MQSIFKSSCNVDDLTLGHVRGYPISVLVSFICPRGGSHFVLEEVSRFHASSGIGDIIPDLSTDVRKTIWRSFILRVSYFEI